MTEWRAVTIEKIASPDRYSVVGGPFGSALGRKDYVDQGVPVIRGAQLGGAGSFSHDNLVFVSDEKANRHQGNLAYPGDILVTQIGTVGKIGLIPNPAPYDRYMLSQNLVKLTVDPTRCGCEVHLLPAALRCQPSTTCAGQRSCGGSAHLMLAKFRALRLAICRRCQLNGSSRSARLDRRSDREQPATG